MWYTCTHSHTCTQSTQMHIWTHADRTVNYTQTHTHTSTQTRNPKHTNSHKQTRQPFTHVHIHTYIHTAQTYTQKSTHTQTQTNRYTHTYKTNNHIKTHTSIQQTHTHTHTHSAAQCHSTMATIADVTAGLMSWFVRTIFLLVSANMFALIYGQRLWQIHPAWSCVLSVIQTSLPKPTQALTPSLCSASAPWMCSSTREPHA